MYLPKDRQALHQFVIHAGPCLVLLGICAFGGRTAATLELLTHAIWLALFIAALLWVAPILQAAAQQRQRPSADRSRHGHRSPSARSAALPAFTRMAWITLVCWGG